MPETSVDEYYSAVPGEHQVRRTDKILAVQSETITLMMRKLAYAEFRFGVLGPIRAIIFDGSSGEKTSIDLRSQLG